MNVFAKRALILTVLVLCLFGITILGASAATGTGYADDAAALTANPSYVARVGDVGVTANYYSDLAEAVAAAAEGDTITLVADVTTDSIIKLEKAITIDGGTHTISTSAVNKVFEVYANATIKNVIITNTYSGGRCVDTRVANITVNLNNVTLQATKGSSQPLTLGGSDLAGLTVNVTDSTIEAGNSGYAVISFVKANLNVTGSQLSGFGVIYFQDQAWDDTTTKIESVITVTGSTLTSTNVHSGESNAFAAIVLQEVSGATLSLINTDVVATATGDQPQAAIDFDNCPVTVTIDKDSTVTADAGDEIIGGLDIATATVTVAPENTALIAALKEEGFTISSTGSIVTPVAKIGETGYATLAEAVAAAQAGDTIKLLSNVTVGTITISKNLTIEGVATGDTYPSICYTDKKVFSLAKATITFTMKNVNIAGNESSPNSNFIYINAGAVATINLENVEFKAGAESTASGIIYSANAQVTITAKNFTLNAGAALFNAPNTPEAGDYVKIALTDCNLNGRPVVNSAARLLARIGAADAQTIACYPTLAAAVAAAASGDTIYLTANHTVSTAFEVRGKTLTVASADPNARVTLTLSATNAVSLYKNSSFTLKDILITANGRKFASQSDSSAGAIPVLIFAKGADLTTTSWANDGVLHCYAAAKFVLEAGASWSFSGTSTGAKVPVFMVAGSTLEIAGNISFTFAGTDTSITGVASVKDTQVIIHSTAKLVNFAPTGANAGRVFVQNSTTAVEFKGFADDAAKAAAATSFRLVKANNNYYVSLYSAYAAAENNSTITLMGDYRMSSTIYPNKTVTITGLNANVTLSSSLQIPFVFNTSDTTFTNMKIVQTGDAVGKDSKGNPYTARFGRIDGSASITFGDNCHVTFTNGEHFLYTNDTMQTGVTVKTWTVTIAETASFKRPTGDGYFMQSSAPASLVGDASAIHIYGTFDVPASSNSGNIYRDSAKHSDGTTNAGGNQNVSIHIYSTAKIVATRGCSVYATALTYYHGMTVDQAMAIVTTGLHQIMGSDGTNFFSVYTYSALSVNNFLSKVANNSILYVRGNLGQKFVITEKTLTFRGWAAGGSIPTISGTTDQFMLGNNGQVTFENMVYTISGRAFRFGDNTGSTTDNNTKFVLGDNFTIKMTSWGTEDLFHSGGASSCSFEMKATATIDINVAANTTGVHRLFYLPENTTQMDFRGTIKINITNDASVPTAYFMGVTNMAGTINIYDTAVFEISITGGQTAYAGATCNHFFRQTNSLNKINIYGGTFTLTGAVTLALSNTEAGNMKVTGGTFTHNGDGSGEDRDVTSIFYRASGSDKLYDISGATLIAKGNAYIFEQGYGLGMVKNCTISSERKEIIYAPEGGWGNFVNVTVAPAADAERLEVAPGILLAGHLGTATGGWIYGGDGNGYSFALAVSAAATAGYAEPLYIVKDMEITSSITLNGGSINLAGANLGTVEAPVYPTLTVVGVDLFTLVGGENVTLTNLNLVLGAKSAFSVPAAMANKATLTLNGVTASGTANLITTAAVTVTLDLNINGGTYTFASDDSNQGFLFCDGTGGGTDTLVFNIDGACLNAGVIRARTTTLTADVKNVTFTTGSGKGFFYIYGSGLTWNLTVTNSHFKVSSGSFIYAPDSSTVNLEMTNSSYLNEAPSTLYASFYYGTATEANAPKFNATFNNVDIQVLGSGASVIYTNATKAEFNLNWINSKVTSNRMIFELLNAGTSSKHFITCTGCDFYAKSYGINIQHKTQSSTKNNVCVEFYDTIFKSAIETLRYTDVGGGYIKGVNSSFICTGTFALGSNTNCMPYMDLYNCRIEAGNNYGTRLYGKAGSYVNFYDVYLSNTSTSLSPLAGGTAIKYNFYGGWIDTKCTAGAFNAISADVEINFYGGTVNVTATSGTASVYNHSTGKVNVYGGQFYSNNTGAALFYNGNPGKEYNVGSYVASGLTELCVNTAAGMASAPFAKNGVSTYNVPRMTAGATPVFTADGIGLGFLGTIPATALDYYKTFVDVLTPADATTNTPATYAISYGMLLVNYEAIKNDPDALRYLTHYGMQTYFANSVAPVMVDLNAETAANYAEAGLIFETVTEEDGCVSVKVSIPADLSTKYGAIVYARYEVNGNSAYAYSAFSAAENVRTLEQVLRSAYNDLSATQSDFYANEVTVGEATMYSHFTADERAAMAEELGANTAREALDLYVVAGGSNAIGYTPVGSDFAADYYANNDLANVYVSGAMALNATMATSSSTTKDVIASKYISAGSGAGLDLGWSVGMMGFEAGLASALAKQYNEETGKFAAIFKYGFEDLKIADMTADGSAIYAMFVAALTDSIAMYTDMGYDVNVVGLYWAQGEADAKTADITTTYPAQFNTLVADLAADLALENLPVAVGELSVYTASGTTITANEAFVEMQNTLENVTIVEIAELLTDNGLYFDPTEVLLAGEIAGSILYNTTVEEADQIVVPKAEPTMQILDANGQPFLGEDGEPVGYRSLAVAIAKLPEGCSIQLTADLTLYAAMTVVNANGAVIDGNNKTITVKASSGSGMVFQNSKIELQNLTIDHTGSAAGTYAVEVDDQSRVTIVNSNLTAEKTVIRMDGIGSTLILKDSVVSSRSEDATATDALIYTTNSNLTIDGGELNATGEAACVYLDASAPEKLAVNIKAGTFNSNATCFINKSVVAIMVASPFAIINAPVAFENAGFGNN